MALTSVYRIPRPELFVTLYGGPREMVPFGSLQEEGDFAIPTGSTYFVQERSKMGEPDRIMFHVAKEPRTVFVRPMNSEPLNIGFDSLHRCCH